MEELKMPVTPKITKSIPIPPDVTIKIAGDLLTVMGPKGTQKRRFSHPRITITISDDTVLVESVMAKKKESAIVGTWEAHISNMIEGVTKGFRYTMKVVYSHFPIKTLLKGNEFIIDNFLGERHPRKAKIVGDTKVEIAGDTVVLTGIDLEEVSQSSANIELATRIRSYDPRVFQDGIYVVEKGYMEEGGEQ
jgi:large subunit ribosomal protein L6